jgi:hypothetical protein
VASITVRIVVVGVVASLVEALLLGVVKTEIRHLEQGWQFPQTGEHGVEKQQQANNHNNNNNNNNNSNAFRMCRCCTW